MPSAHSRVVALAACVLAAVALASCAKSQDLNQSAPTSAAASETVAAHSADDVMFAQMMIPHHQQAVQLAALVGDHSSNQALLSLAAKISAEQQPEITAMKALLLQWDVDPNVTPDHSGMPMQGMVDDATMAKLESLRGPEFDTLWLQSMISHHQGAIEMADNEVAHGRSADMTALARSMVTAQQAEIDQMKQMLGG